VEAETVVVGAHLDHDGLDADGVIYNGADDNASGVAAVLAIGDALARAAARGDRPRRAVVLALWNGEEKGLLGSRHFVGAPLPAGRTPVAYVNLDMVGRSEEVPAGPDARFRGLAPTPARASANAVDLLGYSRTPEMALVVGQESGAVGLEVRERYDTHVQDLLRRSDHWSFLRAGIPAVGFTTGLHPDYHRPTDDADLIDYRKLERVSRLAFRVVWRLADAAAPPPPIAASAPTEP
jgi:Zn-dependent M28 family amino/carboxypeptidase